MSAPVVERPRAGSTRVATAPTRATRPMPKPAAVERSRPRRVEPSTRQPARDAARPVVPGRAQFVLTVMVLLGIGLIATLWLSTAAAADSYRLQDARAAARDLSERSERLHRDVAALQSPPALAQRASELGMVPAQDPARLVVAPDGTTTVVGEPVAAVAPPVAAAPPGLGGAVAPVTPRAPAGTSVESAPRSVLAAAVAAVKPAAEEAEAAEAAEQAAEGDGTDSTATEDDADSTGETTGRTSRTGADAADADTDSDSDSDSETGTRAGSRTNTARAATTDTDTDAGDSTDTDTGTSRPARSTRTSTGTG